MIELTEEQMQALDAHREGPLKIVHPRTQEVFVLIPQHVYQLTSRIVSGPNRQGWDSPADDDLIRKKP
jgi:hypothetical protein